MDAVQQCSGAEMSVKVQMAPQFCRACLSPCADLRSIFKAGMICGQVTRLADMLASCTNLEFCADDGLPAHICNRCVSHLSRAFAFIQLCVQSDDTLRARIHERVKQQYQLVVNAAGTVVIIKSRISAAAVSAAAKAQLPDGTARQPRKPRTRIARPPGPPFECAVCHKQLSNFNSYKYHMRLHSDEKPYVCDVCGEGFKTPNAYDGHMVTHNANNPHTCDICQKSYRQAASLRSHMLTHTGEKPFTCNICGKGMTQKSGYKKHMLTHSGEKPHQCDVCHKYFRYSSNLFMHKRSHTLERPFACDQCSKAFSTNEQLKRHKTTHAGEKRFVCNLCGRAFNRKATMMSHRNRHIRIPRSSDQPDDDEDEEEVEYIVNDVDELDDEMGPYETLELETDSVDDENVAGEQQQQQQQQPT